MESNGIAQFFEGKTIFITGATGFLSKILVQKILRIQPNVKKLFLLIRATNSKSVGQRLHEEIIETELFRVLLENWGTEGLRFLISEKLVAISGDISCENLGIQDSDLRDHIWREVDIMINSAATTRFDERYDVAYRINTLGPIHALDFAKKCLKMKVLLHVSTAYASREETGIIPEKAMCMNETFGGSSCLDIDAEKMLVNERLRELEAANASLGEIRSAMKDFGTQRANLHGWPNTYAFTKAMGEMLLKKYKEKLNVIILRPTIISSTFKDPFPGWVEGLRTIDSLIAAHPKGNLKFFIGDPEIAIDMIPGDMLVNSILVSIKIHANQSLDQYIYHVGSSRRNPVKYADVCDYCYSYFIKNPWIRDRGKPVKLRKLKLLSVPEFHKYISTRYFPFLQALKWVNFL